MKARRYRLTKKAEQLKVNNQSALVLEVLQRDFEVTTAHIAKEIAPVLKTRQTPERVVAFYISTWKKLGYVEALIDEIVEESKTPVSPATSGDQEPTPAIVADAPSAENLVTPAEKAEGEDSDARRARYLKIDLSQPVTMADACLFTLAVLNEGANVGEVCDYLVENMGWEDVKADEVGTALRFLLDEGLVLRDAIGNYSTV